MAVIEHFWPQVAMADAVASGLMSEDQMLQQPLRHGSDSNGRHCQGYFRKPQDDPVRLPSAVVQISKRVRTGIAKSREDDRSSDHLRLGQGTETWKAKRGRLHVAHEDTQLSSGQIVTETVVGTVHDEQNSDSGNSDFAVV